MKVLLAAALLTTVGMNMSGCATLSEDECATINWSDKGYSDGVRGENPNKIADYIDACGEYGFSVDRNAYLSSYQNGLPTYCTYDKGWSRGEGGSGLNGACSSSSFPEFHEGYAEGYAIYKVKQGHVSIINEMDNVTESLRDVRDRLRNDDLDYKEEQRLLKKRDRLEDRRIDLRYELRDYERIHNIPPYNI